nr:hypothetical protein [Gammaproteobacteria bacterium]
MPQLERAGAGKPDRLAPPLHRSDECSTARFDAEPVGLPRTLREGARTLRFERDNRLPLRVFPRRPDRTRRADALTATGITPYAARLDSARLARKIERPGPGAARHETPARD